MKFLFSYFFLKGYIENRVALKSPLKKACQHSVAHASLRCTSPLCLSNVCSGTNTSHYLYFPGCHKQLPVYYFMCKVILYHKVIKGETCNLGLSFKNADLAPAELQPLILSVLARGVHKAFFGTVFAITLCLSREACVYANINPMWKPQSKCKHFGDKVENGKKLSLSICMRLLWITNYFL